jgi:putative phosphoribosyl transferase
MITKLKHKIASEEIKIQTPKTVIKGDLYLPHKPQGIIIFAHGAGSSRLSPRNQHVAELLYEAGFASLLMDLLSEEEDQLDIFTRKLRFDIPLLAGRVDNATEWVLKDDRTNKLPVGYFGASTGAAAALVASIQRPETIHAIVSRGGRPDLADNVLSEVKPPTLLIVGSEDTSVLEKNQMAFKKLNSEKRLVIIQGATHLFEEPGKLDEVAIFAKRWFREYLVSHELKSESDPPNPHIDSYSFGYITIDGVEYNEDLIVFPDRIKSFWWRNDGHILKTVDLDEVIEYKPQLLIIGTGFSGRMHLEPATREYLRREGIKVIEDLTGNAVKLFNNEITKRTKVTGAFHLTC